MKNDTSAKKGAKNTILFIAIFMMFLGAIGYYEFLSPSQEHLKKNTVERLLPDAHVHAQTSKKEKVLFTVATDNEEIELVRKELHEASKQRFVNYLDILSLKGQCVLLDKVSYAATGFLYTRAPKEQRLFLEKLINSTSFSLEVVVNTMIGIPYNPYEPKPYERWTLKGMLDLQHETLIAEELWDFIGGEGTYAELLKAFEDAGIELRPEIDSYFEKFRSDS